MKKFIVLLAVAGFALFAACEEKQNSIPEIIKPEQPTHNQENIPADTPKETPGSLANTTWSGITRDDGDWWWKDEMKFTDTHVTHTITTPNTIKNGTFHYPYFYDPPTIRSEKLEIGTVEGDKMTIIVWMTLDIRRTATLEKQ